MQIFICIFNYAGVLFFIPKKSLKNPAKNFGLFTTTIFICTSLSQHRKSIIPAAISANASIISISLVDKKHRHIKAAPKSSTAAPVLLPFLCLIPLTTFNTFYSLCKKVLQKTQEE